MGGLLSFAAICALAGFALIFVSILGGGLTIKELSVPPLRPLARMMVALLGLAMLSVALLSSGIITSPPGPQPDPATQGVVAFVDQADPKASSEILQLVIDGQSHTLAPKPGELGRLELPATGKRIEYTVQLSTTYPDGSQVVRSGSGALILEKGKTYDLKFAANSLAFYPVP